MELDWKIKKSESAHSPMTLDKGLYTIYLAEFAETAEQPLKLAIEACITKGIDTISRNVSDDSLYLFFEWDMVDSILTIVVTDDTKKIDARTVTKCYFSAVDKEIKALDPKDEGLYQQATEEYSAKIRYWIRDFLTTDSAYLNYALVAAYHDSTREQSQLL
ncbi:MAG: hypothetical protein COB04_14950 [Gammaproteobacteria bacterium]|nr:MAG: hypothetical protein COB04_14950 [Gammaproteobacteria bacterium]